MSDAKFLWYYLERIVFVLWSHCYASHFNRAAARRDVKFMAKLLMLQLNPFVQLGTCSLAAVVKQSGHEFELRVANLNQIFWNPSVESTPIDRFLLHHGIHEWAIEAARKIRKVFPATPIVMGVRMPHFIPR